MVATRLLGRALRRFGGIFIFGILAVLSLPGSASGVQRSASATVVVGDGYWIAAADGSVYAHGDAPFLGRPPI